MDHATSLFLDLSAGTLCISSRSVLVIGRFRHQLKIFLFRRAHAVVTACWLKPPQILKHYSTSILRLSSIPSPSELQRIVVVVVVRGGATVIRWQSVSVLVASSQAVRRARRHRTILAGSSEHDGSHQRASTTVTFTRYSVTCMRVM